MYGYKLHCATSVTETGSHTCIYSGYTVVLALEPFQSQQNYGLKLKVVLK